ncbi:MAG: thioredoxin [Microthrixaceae bacterium]
MSASIVHLTEGSFDEVINAADRPVLVDFWADWCGPCRQIAPILDEISAEKADSIQVAKVDVEANGGLAIRFGVKSIPMMLLFKDGEIAHSMIGARNKEQLLSDLAPYL